MAETEKVKAFCDPITLILEKRGQWVPYKKSLSSQGGNDKGETDSDGTPTSVTKKVDRNRHEHNQLGFNVANYKKTCGAEAKTWNGEIEKANELMHERYRKRSTPKLRCS